MIGHYSPIYNLGHKELEHLFDGEVLVEEKVDGSQFSWRKKEDGEVEFRSKGREIHLPCTDKLFKDAIDYVLSIKDHYLVIGCTYRGEVLCKPKHNAIVYNRVPNHNIVLFDIDVGDQYYTAPISKKLAAGGLELEVVPQLYSGKIDNIEQLRELLNKESFLGGSKVEGIVIKNYNQYGRDNKVLMGKWVSEAFKEKHRKDWKNSNPSIGDFVQQMKETYRHENRWKKAIQHLKEAGKLQNDPKDIGPLMGEIVNDVKKECEDEIKEKMWKYYWPKIARGLTAGFPQFYKDQLAKSQFKEVDNEIS